jgi:hypothetical protein
MNPRHAIAGLLVLLTCSLLAPGQTLEEVGRSDLDLWGEGALKQPGGPNFDYFAKLLPPLRYVDANFKCYPITLSAPSQPTKARIVSNGSAINALARQPTWVNEAGRPVTFYVGDKRDLFGSNLAMLDGPKYAEGYLPIAQFAYESQGATWAEEAFASCDPELSDLGVVFVKLTLKKASGKTWRIEPAKDQDPASTKPVAGVEGEENVLLLSRPFDEKIEASIEGPEQFSYKDRRVATRTEHPQVIALMHPGWVSNPGRGAIMALLKEGESAYLAIFTKPADAASLKFKLTPESYEDQRAQCAKTWNDLLNRGTVVETPEPVVNNAWRASIIGNYELISGDQMRYSQGNQYAKRYIGEGGDAIRATALWGQPDDAKRLMAAQFEYTRAGLEFHQAAFKLQMLVHYFRLTKDAEAVRSMRPMWQKELDVILKGRQTDNGMFPREKYCGDVDLRVFSLNSNANAWRAIRDWSMVLADLGESDAAKKLADTATEYRKIIQVAIDEATRRDVDPPFVPIALSGEETPHDPIWGTTIGSYWNLMIEYVLGSGVFTPESQTATDILHYIQQRGGLCMGILRARTNPGNFYVHGGRMNDLYGMRYALTLLHRDEPDRALVSFYGKLAQGMTRDTFIGCEGSSMGSVDEFGRQMALPPNSAANSSFLQQLRYILVQDEDLNDDGRAETLRLAFASPRAWLSDGGRIAVKKAPTEFGEVSFVIESALKDGHVDAEVDLPARAAPEKVLLRLRLPDGKKLASTSAGKVIADGETIDLSGLNGHIKLVAQVAK